MEDHQVGAGLPGSGTDSQDRYSRQTRFRHIGDAGQNRLAQSRAVVCGCGALGGTIAAHLARAGVGFLRIVDRDFVELHNLQRQLLFDESDLQNCLPKAEAAARKLRNANSNIQIEPIVADVDSRNILDLVSDVDVILDGTDNFDTRYLINDAAVKLGKPWVFGGVIGSEGQSMTIRPGITPCLRCVIEQSPPPGMTPTCETAGILAPAAAVIASIQAVEAIKLLVGAVEALNRDFLVLDLWDWSFRRLSIRSLLDAASCPCCNGRRFEWLDGGRGTHTTALCGRNAVQIAAQDRAAVSFPELSARLSGLGKVRYNQFLLKFETGDFEFTVFPDGRAIIKGTDDLARARSLYAQYVGH